MQPLLSDPRPPAWVVPTHVAVAGASLILGVVLWLLEQRLKESTASGVADLLVEMGEVERIYEFEGPEPFLRGPTRL